MAVCMRTRVVVALDPVHDVQPGLSPALVAYLVDPLDPQRFEKTLHGRVVPGVAFPAHRHREAEVRRQAAVLMTGVLAPAVRVHQQSGKIRRHRQTMSRVGGDSICSALDRAQPLTQQALAHPLGAHVLALLA